MGRPLRWFGTQRGQRVPKPLGTGWVASAACLLCLGTVSKSLKALLGIGAAGVPFPYLSNCLAEAWKWWDRESEPLRRNRVLL